MVEGIDCSHYRLHNCHIARCCEMVIQMALPSSRAPGHQYVDLQQ
jgi:hypothetical protein